MINLDDVAIAIVVTTLCHGHYAAICRIDRSAFAIGNVNAQVA